MSKQARKYGQIREVRVKPESPEAVADRWGDGRGRPSAAVADAVTQIRLATPSDLNFIRDSWASSYRASPDVTDMDPELYKVEVRAYIEAVRRQGRIFVACDPDAPDDIRGWVCCERPREKNGLWLVHYVLVRPEWQRQGIATALLKPLRDNSPDGMLWATSYTIGLKRFARDYLLRNRFIDGRKK